MIITCIHFTRKHRKIKKVKLENGAIENAQMHFILRTELVKFKIIQFYY